MGVTGKLSSLLNSKISRTPKTPDDGTNLEQTGKKKSPTSLLFRTSTADFAKKRFNLTDKEYKELKNKAEEETVKYRKYTASMFIDTIDAKSKSINQKQMRIKSDTMHPSAAKSSKGDDKQADGTAFGYYKEKYLFIIHPNPKYLVIVPQVKRERDKLKKTLKHGKEYNLDEKKSRDKVRKHDLMKKKVESTVEQKASPRHEDVSVVGVFESNTTDDSRTIFPSEWYGLALSKQLVEFESKTKKKDFTYWKTDDDDDDIEMEMESQESGKKYQSVTSDDVLDVLNGKKIIKDTGLKPPDANQRYEDLRVLWENCKKTSDQDTVYAHTLTGAIDFVNVEKTVVTAVSKRKSEKRPELKWLPDMEVVVFEGTFLKRKRHMAEKTHKRVKEPLENIDRVD